jgi:hypothetical protein
MGACESEMKKYTVDSNYMYVVTECTAYWMFGPRIAIITKE